MATTKYGLDTMDYSVTDVYGIHNTAIQKVDNFMQTYLRLKVKSGEYDLQTKRYQPLCIQDDEWRQARDDGVRLPVAAVSVELGLSGEWMLGQRAGKCQSSGEDLWSWDPLSGEVWVSGEGTVIQNLSGENWQNRRARVGVVCDSTSIVLQI
jgi:hypothetical protein